MGVSVPGPELRGRGMDDTSAGEEVSALEHASACEWAAWRDIDVHVTSTRTDISPLACTAENSMDLSALSKSPARFGMLARGRVSEDADGRLCESLAIR